MKVLLKKDLLFDDQMYGKESIIDMIDEGRLDYLLKSGHAVKADEKAELTKKPPPPKPLRSPQASELVEAITEAIRGKREPEANEIIAKARAE